VHARKMVMRFLAIARVVLDFSQISGARSEGPLDEPQLDLPLPPLLPHPENSGVLSFLSLMLSKLMIPSGMVGILYGVKIAYATTMPKINCFISIIYFDSALSDMRQKTTKHAKPLETILHGRRRPF